MRRELAMITAREILHEIVAHVSPTPRSVITLAEVAFETPNWSANLSSMPKEQTERFREVIATFAESAPQIDWTGETTRSGSERRIIHHREGENTLARSATKTDVAL